MKNYGELEYDQYSILFLLSVITMFLTGVFYMINEDRGVKTQENARAERLFNTYIRERNLILKKNSERYLDTGVVDRSQFEFMAVENSNSWKVYNGWNTDISREELKGMEEILSQGRDGILLLRERYYLYSGAWEGRRRALSFWEIDENFMDIFYNTTGVRAQYGRGREGHTLEVANYADPLNISFTHGDKRRSNLYVIFFYSGGLLILLWIFNRAFKVRFKDEEDKLLEVVGLIRESEGSKEGAGDITFKRLNQALLGLGEEYRAKVLEVRELRSALTKTNLELRELVISDRLTGVYNKSFMYEMLEDMEKQDVKAPYHRVIMMIDLDNFKKLNDSEGHLAGDRLLVEVGELLKDLGRGRAKVFRYGGDEFFLIFNRIKYEEFLEVLNELEKKKYQLTKRYLHVKLGISAGAVVVGRDDEMDGEKLIKRADDLLYEAKKKGKNRIIIDS